MRLINNSAQLISVGFTHQKEQQKLQQKQQQQKQEENNNESSFYPGGWRVLKKVKSFPRSSSLAISIPLSRYESYARGLSVLGWMTQASWREGGEEQVRAGDRQLVTRNQIKIKYAFLSVAQNQQQQLQQQH